MLRTLQVSDPQNPTNSITVLVDPDSIESITGFEKSLLNINFKSGKTMYCPATMQQVMAQLYDAPFYVGQVQTKTNGQ